MKTWLLPGTVHPVITSYLFFRKKWSKNSLHSWNEIIHHTVNHCGACLLMNCRCVCIISIFSQVRGGCVQMTATYFHIEAYSIKQCSIFQATFSNAFSLMKMYKFRIKFHLTLYLKVQLTIFQNCFRYWLGAGQATSHYLNQWWLVYWRIYELMSLWISGSTQQALWGAIGNCWLLLHHDERLGEKQACTGVLYEYEVKTLHVCMEQKP